MNEPQVTNFFASREEESKWLIQRGKEMREAEILKIIDRMIQEKKDFCEWNESMVTLEDLKEEINSPTAPSNQQPRYRAPTS